MEMNISVILSIIVGYGLMILALFVLAHRFCTSFPEIGVSVRQGFARICTFLRKHGLLPWKLQRVRAESTAKVEVSVRRS